MGGEEWKWKSENCVVLSAPTTTHSGLASQTVIQNQRSPSKQKPQGIGIMPQTFYLWLVRSGPAHKPLLNYRHTSGTPRNLISFLEIRPGSAEESAMHTAVSKAITREQERSLPTSHGCFPSPMDVTFHWLEQDVQIKFTVAVREKKKRKRQITGNERRQIVFSWTPRCKMGDVVSSFAGQYTRGCCALWRALTMWSRSTSRRGRGNVTSIV